MLQDIPPRNLQKWHACFSGAWWPNIPGDSRWAWLRCGQPACARNLQVTKIMRRSFNWRQLARKQGVFCGRSLTGDGLQETHCRRKPYFTGLRGLSYHCVWDTNLAGSDDKLPLANAFAPEHMESYEGRQTVMSVTIHIDSGVWRRHAAIRRALKADLRSSPASEAGGSTH